MGETSIEWTNATWNPVRGCSVISPGCTNCYAMGQAHRYSGIAKKTGKQLPFYGLTRGRPKGGPVWTGDVRFVPEMLDVPLRWKEPRRIFVNSMSDLFHEGFTDEQIAEVFGVMAVASGAFHGPGDGFDKIGKPFPLYEGGKPVQHRMPRSGHGPHVFQLLTKRAKRLPELLGSSRFRTLVAGAAHRWAIDRTTAGALSDSIEDGSLWPLPNLWLGVSVEDQKHADERIPHLLATPAAVRWISAEPLLGPLDLAKYLPLKLQEGNVWRECDCDEIDPSDRPCLVCDARSGLSWVVCGGESGPDARPFDLAWARSILRQCREAGVPAFFKQAGRLVVDSDRQVGRDAPEDKRTLRAMKALKTDHAAFNLVALWNRKGGDMAEWPEDLHVREWPALDSDLQSRAQR